MRQIWMAMVLVVGCAGGAPNARLGVRYDRQLKERAETAILRGLASADVAERLQATRIAVELADPAIDPALPPRLTDPDPRIRALAAVALSGHESAQRVLLLALSGPDADARRIAVDAIAAFDEGIAILEKLSTDPDPGVRARVAAELGAGKARGAASHRLRERTLEQLCADGDAGVRAAALRALTALAPRMAQPRIDRALADPALSVRLAALAALMKIDDSPARLAAIDTGADRYLAVRLAVQLHRRGRAPQALLALRAAAIDRLAEVRAAAMNAAGELGDAGAAIALPLLRDPDLAVRLSAARAMIHAGHPDPARPVLLAALHTPFALDAADELARLGDPRGRAHLDAALASDDVAVRRRALQLAAPLPASLPALAHALDDSDATIRLAAAETLLRRAFPPR
ncbi:MAG TPA: hypothetical protein VMZ28_01820 [Kofleriaceae bacterium]|nr:hypothetical protein [Kofleriaceae bacterium]